MSCIEIALVVYLICITTIGLFYFRKCDVIQSAWKQHILDYDRLAKLHKAKIISDTECLTKLATLKSRGEYYKKLSHRFLQFFPRIYNPLQWYRCCKEIREKTEIKFADILDIEDTTMVSE